MEVDGIPCTGYSVHRGRIFWTELPRHRIPSSVLIQNEVNYLKSESFIKNILQLRIRCSIFLDQIHPPADSVRLPTPRNKTACSRHSGKIHIYRTPCRIIREACRIKNFPDDLSRENSLFHFLPNWAAEGSALQAHHSGSRFHDIHFARFSQRRFWIASFV